MRPQPYLPLEEYGLVGDGGAAALVARDGSIDWLCLPRFDSPSLFARLLDHRRAGFWQLRKTEPAETTFAYRGRSAVLETEHRAVSGAARVTDAMLPSADGTTPCALVRLCEGLSGEVELESLVEPGADFGRASQAPEPWGEDGWNAERPSRSARGSAWPSSSNGAQTRSSSPQSPPWSKEQRSRGRPGSTG